MNLLNRQSCTSKRNAVQTCGSRLDANTQSWIREYNKETIQYK